MHPDTSVRYVPGVGPARAALLAKLGIETVGRLLRHYPSTHEDRTRFAEISELRPETHATVRGRVRDVRVSEVGRGRKVVVKAVVEDATGALAVEFWQQRFRAEQLRVGREVLLTGRVTWDRGPRMSGPEVETADEDDAEGMRLHADRIVPIHPLTKRLYATTMRTLVARALDACADEMPDPLPASIRQARGLLPIAHALREVHFPATFGSLAEARRRLAYEELFLLQVALAKRRLRHVLEDKPHQIVVDDRLDARIRARFPFTATKAQDRVIAEIRADLAKSAPMNRLLQGDVGSGKTLVAAYAMLAAVANKLQAALLAPTAILAEQHMRTLSRYLEGSKVRLALVAGGGATAQKRESRRLLADGDVDIVVGTHALLEEDVRFARLGLVVVDEQHKFGVMQRSALRRKGLSPDLLVMSATPIPRTLTMTLFGDLDLSVIDELPPGRSPVATVLAEEGDRGQVYEWVRREIAKGRRAYHVVPLVDDDKELPLRSVHKFAAELAEGPFRGTRVGVLHGKMSAAAKDAAMEAFRSGATPLLVATSVVEVGVDVPEATALVVEHAERFGLAQLHQLRGRVGRGADASRVVLFHDAQTESARARLKALVDTTDGFRIAEEDLRIRGPGEFLGTRQHGITELVAADLVRDALLLSQARDDAFALVQRDPALTGEGAGVMRAFAERFGPRGSSDVS
jgi:ATP-dependent DNA helicase RecG